MFPSILQNTCRYLVLFLGLFVVFRPVKSQEVERNYPMGPQVTNCDSLIIQEKEEVVSIEGQLERTVFRFTQEFMMKRLSGLQFGKYYSCDGAFGYLVIQFNGEKSIFESVDKKAWEIMIDSSDPDQYFLDHIRQNYLLITE